MNSELKTVDIEISPVTEVNRCRKDVFPGKVSARFFQIETIGINRAHVQGCCLNCKCG